MHFLHGRKYAEWTAYAQSKLGDIYMAKHLASRCVSVYETFCTVPVTLCTLVLTCCLQGKWLQCGILCSESSGCLPAQLPVLLS